MPLTIQPIPAFNDNYIWLIHSNQQAFVVDPGDPAPVLSALSERGLTLSGILITHHHPDHTGGLLSLKKETGCTVYGPENPTIDGIDQRLSDGAQLTVLGELFKVVTVPGHTLDHIAYVNENAGESILFCGDTLFAGGCGRVFEGTFPMMRNSLEKLRNLPANTQVYCAHEYTLANLKFALAAEPENAQLKHRNAQCQQARDNGEPTVPSNLRDELATNPFLRWDAPELIATLQAGGKLTGTDPDAVFAALRQWKDNF